MSVIETVFHDKASLILRYLLEHREQSCTATQVSKTVGVSKAWVARVVAALRQSGLIQGIELGRNSTTCLRHAEDLIQAWIRFYQFSMNNIITLYTPDTDPLKKIKQILIEKKHRYALTLHSGANLITNYVLGNNFYCYLEPTNFKKTVMDIKVSLDLKELKEGGNVHFIFPYYAQSVFWGFQTIKGYPVVSNLQLYLDLYHYPVRGREHAEYLLKTLRHEGIELGQS